MKRDITNKYWDAELETLPSEELETRQLADLKEIVKFAYDNAPDLYKRQNPKREVYMAEARRKTTLEERKEIVEYCISHFCAPAHAVVL